MIHVSRGVIDTGRAIAVCPRRASRDKRAIGLDIVCDELVPIETVGLKVAKRNEWVVNTCVGNG